MIGCAAYCTEAVHKNTDHDWSGCQVIPFDSQLKRGSVRAQDHILAPAGFYKKMLKARERWKKDAA
jgi:hypothetical protein